jgi:hypothetical protein
MADTEQSNGCGCCGTDAEFVHHIGPVRPGMRAQLAREANRLGLDDGDRLTELFDTADCRAVRTEMEQQVEARLGATTNRVVDLVERAARLRTDPVAAEGSEQVGDVVALIVDLGGAIGPLQEAAARLAASTAQAGACHADCGCLNPSAETPLPRVPASRMALTAAAAVGGSDIVCTLTGGTDAMRARVDQWQAVLNRAVGREPASGGVTLRFDHDPAVVVELARLAAAEFACC